MTENKHLVNLLAVDDGPESIREVEDLLENRNLRLHFADTPNAFGRILEDEDIDLGLIHIHEGSKSLLDPLVRLLRGHHRPIPLFALVDPDPDSAIAAAESGVCGCVRVDDPRGVVRVLDERLRLMLENRVQAEQLSRTRDIQERYNLLLESSSEAIAYLHEGLHIYANPSYIELFGYQNFEELEGLSILDMLSSDKGGVDLKRLLKSITRGELPDEPLELQAHRADGESFRAAVEFAPAHYDGETCTQILIREQVQAGDNADLQRELEKLRSHDMLTGLLNRQAFISSLNREIGSTKVDRNIAIVLVTLDNFTELQRKVGSSATDSLIHQFAEHFQELVTPEMIPARLSDFVLAARVAFNERSEAEQLATDLVEGFSGHILEVGEKSPTVTVSVGLAVDSRQMFTADELLAQAESALREAERSGGNSYLRYRPRAAAESNEDHAQWTETIKHALGNDNFRLVQIPVTSMEDEQFLIHEFEIRLRMEGSDEIIMASAFREPANQSGLSAQIDLQIISNLDKWLQANPNDRHLLLVPISYQGLDNEEVVNSIQQLIDSDGLDARRLIIGFRIDEIRENLRELQRLTTRFGAHGVRFALLGAAPNDQIDLIVKNVAVQYIKLGGDISAALRNDEQARAALQALSTTASENGIRVIAPPVEATTDLATLWQFGITLVQGDFVRDGGE